MDGLRSDDDDDFGFTFWTGLDWMGTAALHLHVFLS